MSKEAALSMLTGNPVPQATPMPDKAMGSEPAKVETLKSDPFAHLAKKEETILRERQALKAEKEAFVKDRETVLKAKQTYEEYLNKKQTDPIEALKMLGFSETDVFNYIANQAPPELTPDQKAVQLAEKAAEAKIKEFQDSLTLKEHQAQVKQDQALIQGYRSEIKSAIQTDPDKFEYCAYYGPEAESLAYEIATEVVKRSKGEDFVDAKEALQMAEEYFEERDKEMSKIKKRQVSSLPSVSPPHPPERSRTLSPPPQSDAPKPAITRSRTLHNGATSTVASTRITRNETRDQKRDRLIDALRNGTKF